MRILILTLFFISAFYYFSPEGPVKKTETDTVEIKAAAPDRAERMLTVNKPLVAPPIDEENSDDVNQNPEREIDRQISGSEEEIEGEYEEGEEVHFNDLDAAWNKELKEFLLRLEPMDADFIHKSYLVQMDAFRAEMEALLNEKQQKETSELISEVDQMISQLDQKHEDKLKEIFGAHYDAIRDHYNNYSEWNSSETH